MICRGLWTVISNQAGASGPSESLAGQGPLPNSLMGYWQAQLLSLELLHDVAGGYTRIRAMGSAEGNQDRSHSLCDSFLKVLSL